MFNFRGKKYIAGILIILFMVPAVFFTQPPQKTEAITVTEIGGNLFTNIASTVESVLITTKEYVLDGLAYAIVNAIIRQMSASIINWINSGFDGNPSFVTDIEGLLTNVADEVAGDFIYRSKDLAFLCSPFSLQVRLSLATSYFDNEPECTLTDVIENIDGFLADFEQGGWDGWFQLTTQSRNNPYGEYLIASSKLSVSLSTAKGEKLQEIDFGDGFLSWRSCSGGEDLAGRTTGSARPDDGSSTSQCPIVTPGSVIEDQLADTLGLSADRLVVADEINEILGALLTYMVREAFTGSGGVRGLSSSSSAGRGSYLERLRNDSSAEEAAIANAQDRLIPRINKDLDEESEYRSIKQQTLDKLNAAAQKVRAVQNCYEEKLERGGLTQNEREIAQERIAAASSTISSSINPKRELIERNIDSSQNATASLEGIAGRIVAAESAQEAEDVLEDYTRLQRNGILHDVGDIQKATEERTNIGAEMNAIIEGAEEDLAECQSFGTNSFSDER